MLTYATQLVSIVPVDLGHSIKTRRNPYRAGQTWRNMTGTMLVDVTATILAEWIYPRDMISAILGGILCMDGAGACP